jgi:hypothetical protein
LGDAIETVRDFQNATPAQARLLRLLKVQEEVGEVAQAAMGAVSANPRKGRSHTWEDVQNELCERRPGRTAGVAPPSPGLGAIA